MFKKSNAVLKNYSKYIDSNVVLQAVFGAAAILCAILACAFDYSLSALFDVLKDTFSTIMVFIVLFVAVSHLKDRFSEKKDKLDYIDFWNENKSDIFECEDVSLFENHLLYGMQAATYTIEETKELYLRIGGILKQKKYSNPQTESVLLCAQAILEVFYKTERLTKPLNQQDFYAIRDKLTVPYEDKINNSNLAAWCKIMRNDKLELAYEFYAENLEGVEKNIILNEALVKCNECIRLLDTQVSKNPNDKNFALLYRSYINRNIAQIHKNLYSIGHNEEDIKQFNKYILITYNNRKELYDHYQFERKTKTLTNDYITQEYILSLAEKYNLEENPTIKQEIENEISSKYKQWTLQNDTRIMLLKRIEMAIDEISSVKE